MFDMSWGEMMVIGAVALIVIGPKDLPKALRTLGNMTTKVRRMASEFQSQFNDAMREAELDEIRKEVEGLNQSVTSLGGTTFDPVRTARDELKGAIEAPVGSGAALPSAGTSEPPAIPPPLTEPPPVAPVGEGAAPRPGEAARPAPELKPDEARA